MKWVHFTGALLTLLTTTSAFADNQPNYGYPQPAAQSPESQAVLQQYAAQDNQPLSVAENAPSNSVETTSAGGEPQTTIIDNNGNLKIVPVPKKAPPATAPVPSEAVGVTPGQNAQNGALPPGAIALPPATTALPPATTVMPPATTVMPPATTVMPPATTVMPPATTAMPPATTAMPPATTVMPPATTVMPPATTVMPPATNVMPPATTVMPPATTRMPPATTRMPPATTTMPPATTAMPTSGAATISSPGASLSTGPEQRIVMQQPSSPISTPDNRTQFNNMNGQVVRN